MESNTYKLTAQELKILALLAKGLHDKEIAFTLVCSKYTVNKHMGHIFFKLGVASRTAAAVKAVKEALVDA